MGLNIPDADFVTTSLNGAITAAATTMTIGTGLDIPATLGVLQLDYDSTVAVGTSEGPETVTYAAYTTATGAITGMTRGAGGTTGVAHDNGSSIQAAPSIEYLEELENLIADTAWGSWTPTWVNLTVGNGTVTAKYIQYGKTVHFRLAIVFGNTTSIDGAGVTFTLPVTAVDQAGAGGSQPLGSMTAFDSGTGQFIGVVDFASTTTATPRVGKADATYLKDATLDSGVPMTWTTSDEITCSGTYEAA